MNPEFRMVLSAFIRFYKFLGYFDAKNLLASKHYPEQIEKAIQYASEADDVTLIIDSGAFSVWNAGGKVDVMEYLEFLKDFDKNHRSKFKEVFYVSLDVIPLSNSTPDQIIEAVEEGYENYLLFKDAGFDNIIHVLHQGDDDMVPDLVDRFLKTNPTYIGISPSNATMTNVRMTWLDGIFSKISPSYRTHGFAVTSMTLMRNYPWFSVDSTSWFMIGMYGKLCIPLDRYGNVITDDTTPVFDKFEVSVSPQRISAVDGYKTLLIQKPGLIKHVDEYIEFLCKKYPIVPAKIFSPRNEGRVLANLAMFLRVEEYFVQPEYQVSSLF